MTVYSVFKSNITRVTTDAVVYSANTHLIKGSGMCKDIFNAAGEQGLTDALKLYEGLQEGEALITSGYNLPYNFRLKAKSPRYSCSAVQFISNPKTVGRKSNSPNLYPGPV